MTKDQTIALATQRDYYEQACKRLTAELDALKKPTPHCRTCTKYRNGYCYILAVGLSADAPVPVCTNGDQYQPAPAVVLWRTE